MRDDLPPQALPENPDPNQETWISKKEVLERYNVTDRQLEYWRDKGRIRYKKINHLTYYVEKEIQEQEKLLAVPKKYTFIRQNMFGITQRTIDPPLAIIGVAFCFAFMNGLQSTARWQVWVFENWPSIELIVMALIWYLIRLIKYTRKRYFRKEKMENS